MIKPVSLEKLFKTLRNFVVKKGHRWVNKMSMEKSEMIEGVLPETMPGLELAAALERVGIPALVFKTILLKFAAANSDKTTEIKECLATGDLEELNRLAHGLKGASGSIGAESLYDMTLALGTSIKKGDDLETISAQVDALNAELGVVLDSLAKL